MKITRLYALIAACVLASASYAPARAASGAITINVRNASLQDVVTLIASQAGINIVLDGAATQSGDAITMHLDRVSLRTALQSLESAYGLAEAWQSGVLHIGPADSILRAFPTSANGGVSQRIFNIVNADPVTIARELESVLPAGTIVVPDVHSSTVVVKAMSTTIATADQLIASLDRPRTSEAAFATVAINLSNVKATDAVATLRTQIPPANGAEQMSASDHPNALLVTGSPDFIAAVRAAAKELDRPGKQVRFSVRVLDVTPMNDESNVGLEFGGITTQGATGASAITPGMWAVTAKKVPIGVIVNTLINNNKGRVLAQPSISSLNNEKAVLNVGEQYPLVYFNPQSGTNNVQFINIGVNLTMTPTIGEDGDVTCALDTDYSEIVDFNGVYPIIGQRHVNTMMRVADDQTIVIGGLFKDIDESTITRFPFLSQIPILGEFFKNRHETHSRDEVVFLITPHIVTPSDFHDAGYSPNAKELQQ